MIPIVQSRTGEDGTCFRACVASILEVPEGAVPDFGASGGDDAWWRDIQDWLGGAGYSYRRAPVGGARPVGWSTIEGISPRGGMHACVAKDGELVHDPHPQDGTGRGLVEPRYYGLFEKIGRAADQAGTMAQLRKKAVREGPFSIQETTKSGKERTIPVRELANGADAYDGPLINTKAGKHNILMPLAKGADSKAFEVLALLAVIQAWYAARKENAQPDTYNLAAYRPKRRAFDGLPLGRYKMHELLDALGIDIKEYMRRTEQQKENLLRTAIERLDQRGR
jgi:hypothetical protein